MAGEITKKVNLTSEELESHGIMRRFYDATFENIETKGVPESISSQYEQIKQYAENLEYNLSIGKGVILCGPYGTMKTTLAVALLRRHLEHSHSGLFVPMCSLIDNLYTRRALSVEDWARYEERIRTTRLLVLDDIGSENTDQKWILQKVDSIITERYNRMRPVVITSNLLPFSKNKDEQTLQNTYGGRVFDRLRSTSELIMFSGKSLRRTI